MAEIVEPLQVLQRKGAKWNWTQECQDAFDDIRNILLHETVLALPDFDKRFTLAKDASDTGCGAVLYQKYENKVHIISYASCTLSTSQRNYDAMEKECLANLWATDKFREYLEGFKFTLVTDNRALTWLKRLQHKNKKMCRWLM
jgi:hypothetical protein